MDLRRLSETVSVAGQITADDVAEIARLGFRSIVCNRPDGESPGQPRQAEIASAARSAGLEFRNVPVISGAMTERDVRDFAAVLDELPGPVLAYCRSGARSGELWRLSRLLQR